MRVIADTNVLVRAITGDHPQQSAVAQAELLNADSVAVPLAALCELVWVLGHGYKLGRHDVGKAIGRLIAVANVSVSRAAAEAGLAMLEAGGDFADGVIAFEGAWLGGDEFISFDRKAVTLIEKQGKLARLLA